jgi:putative spermidine/putrescine transport system permease protein
LSQRDRWGLIALVLPGAIFFIAFFAIPLTKLWVIGGSGALGWSAYASVLTNERHLSSMLATLALSSAVTLITLVIAGIAGVFLARHEFKGKALLTAMLTLPLAFPGVVIGFMVIMLGGRQGLVPAVTEHLFDHPLVFAYSMVGLLVGYVYFSIPRTILTVMAAAEKLDTQQIEAARSLGAGPWRLLCDIIVPALRPALLAASAICFATSMGAFGTAFTLATKINVLPMIIYTEFTLSANMAMAAALSFVLGFITWIALAFARSLTGSTVPAAA